LLYSKLHTCKYSTEIEQAFTKLDENKGPGPAWLFLAF
jgi:hypothetical protein